MEIREARLEDSGHFVRVFELASFGLAPYFWQMTAGEGGNPRAVAMKSMQDKITKAAANTALIAEVDGQAAGGIITYAIGNEIEEISSDCDPVIIPLINLENKALNTHYINAIAVFPEYQQRGVATALLRQVYENAGPCGMSLIVEDQNEKARKLYEREGFVMKTSAPITKCGWETTAQEYILMSRASA